MATDTITPATATLKPGGTQQFHSSNEHPTWSCAAAHGEAGSISAAGLYTAPGAGASVKITDGHGGTAQVLVKA